jgi:hypothetical protein
VAIKRIIRSTTSRAASATVRIVLGKAKTSGSAIEKTAGITMAEDATTLKAAASAKAAALD